MCVRKSKLSNIMVITESKFCFRADFSINSSHPLSFTLLIKYTEGGTSCNGGLVSGDCFCKRTGNAQEIIPHITISVLSVFFS